MGTVSPAGFIDGAEEEGGSPEGLGGTPWGQGRTTAAEDDAGAGAVDAWDSERSKVKLNPYRYAAYCYDRETELYFLQSRYYDPGRTGS